MLMGGEPPCRVPIGSRAVSRGDRDLLLCVTASRRLCRGVPASRYVASMREGGGAAQPESAGLAVCMSRGAGGIVRSDARSLCLVYRGKVTPRPWGGLAKL